MTPAIEPPAALTRRAASGNRRSRTCTSQYWGLSGGSVTSLRSGTPRGAGSESVRGSNAPASRRIAADFCGALFDRGFALSALLWPASVLGRLVVAATRPAPACAVARCLLPLVLSGGAFSSPTPSPATRSVVATRRAAALQC